MYLEEIKNEVIIDFVDGSQHKIFPPMMGSEYEGLLFVHDDNNRIIVKEYKQKSFPHGTGREPVYGGTHIISIINFRNVTTIRY